MVLLSSSLARSSSLVIVVRSSSSLVVSSSSRGAFYVAFVLAPLASNASELIAAYSYAAKKTPRTIGIALSALTGAGSMNNTFCLGIFMGLVVFRGLAWQVRGAPRACPVQGVLSYPVGRL